MYIFIPEIIPLLGPYCLYALNCLESQGPNYREGVMELNASNDRGVETVRNKIKMFAQQKVTLPKGRHKISILDEADSMTEAAQQALRRTMELYISTTRFALACKSSEKIIVPIQSRCAMLRYSKLSDAQVLANILAVCKAENVEYSDDGAPRACCRWPGCWPGSARYPSRWSRRR